MTLPDLHLAEDALTAYVDGMLSPAADDRATRHLRACAECREAVDAGRESKALLGAAPGPDLPAGLLARLLEVPMTADLGPGPGVLAVDGEDFGWATDTPGDGRVVERRATATASGARAAGVPTAGARAAGGPTRPRGPAGPSRPGGRALRSRRTRRGLAVSLAGLAFGVIASAATSTAPGSAAPARPGEGPGSQTRLVVGTSVPMDVARTFQFRRPAGAPALVPATRPDR